MRAWLSHVVGAPEGDELAVQIGPFVTVLGATHPVDRVRAIGLADLEQLVADLVDRLLPGDPLVLAVDQLHRVFQAPLAMTVLAHRCALGAMGAEIERAVEAWLLADPDAVLDLGDDRAADRAVGADALDLLQGARRRGHLRLRLGHHAARERGGRGHPAGCQARATKEAPAIDGATGEAGQGRRQTGTRCHPVGLLSQHGSLQNSGSGQTPARARVSAASPGLRTWTARRPS